MSSKKPPKKPVNPPKKDKGRGKEMKRDDMEIHVDEASGSSVTATQLSSIIKDNPPPKDKGKRKKARRDDTEASGSSVTATQLSSIIKDNPPPKDKSKRKEVRRDDMEVVNSSIVIIICLVHGDSSSRAFSIRIDKNYLIDDLKDKIREKNPATFADVDAKDLTLWMVNIPTTNKTTLPDKITLEWVNAQTSRETIVEGISRSIKVDNPTQRLNKVFNNLLDEHIHVIVEGPLEEHTRKRKRDEDKFDTILEAIRENKKSTVSISRITQKHYNALLTECGLFRKSVEFNVTPTTKPIEPFVWGNKKEDAYAQGRQGYLNWLESNIDLPDDVQFYIASSKADLLSTPAASKQFDFKGTLDAVIVNRLNIKTLNIAGGIRIGLEHKKQVKESDLMQAIVELITVNIRSIYPVVMVLTDLRQHWQFFWLQRGCVVDCVFNLKKGITLLETIVQQPKPPVGQSTPDAPYLQRCDLETATLQARKSGDALPEDMEVEGLEGLLQRPKVDIMDILPKDDVADMRDVFDVMTPEEVHEWQMRRVLDYAIKRDG